MRVNYTSRQPLLQSHGGMAAPWQTRSASDRITFEIPLVRSLFDESETVGRVVVGRRFGYGFADYGRGTAEARRAGEYRPRCRAPEVLGSRLVARALENARLYRDRDHVARVLQQGLLPPRLPDVQGAEIAAFFRPAERRQGIGGDFYDVFEVEGDKWLAVVGDVCGKGVEAATLTGMVRHTLRALTRVERPSHALAFVNRALLREELDGRFCTIAAILFAPVVSGGARATVSVAGHPLPQLLGRDGSVARVGAHGTLLGVTPDVHLVDTDVVLSPGDALVAFTDGLLAKHEVTGDEPTSLLRSLTGRRWASADAIRDEIASFVRDNPGGHDDVAFLVLRAIDQVS